MVVIAQSENAECMEWQDEDALELTVPQADVTGLPICSMTDHDTTAKNCVYD